MSFPTSPLSRSRHSPRPTVRQRRGLLEPLEPRLLLAADWRNPADSLDVNGDGNLAPLDALLVINELNSAGSHALPVAKPTAVQYLDSQGDGFVSPIDALLVINYLNQFGDSRRTLRAGGQFEATQDVVISVGGRQDGARIYQVEVDGQFDASTQNRLLPDLFSVYLVDKNQTSTTLLDRGVNGTSLFSLSAGGATESIPGIARWDGRTLQLDLTQVAAVDTAVLRFQLLTGSATSSSRVRFKPLSNAFDAARTPAAGSGEEPATTAAGGTLNGAALIAAPDLQPRLANARFDAASGLFVGDYALRNEGNAVGRTASLVLPGLPAGVTVVNRSGIDGQGRPYVNFSPAVGDGGLLHDVESARLRVEIANPQGLPLNLQPLVLVGPPNRAPDLPAIADRTTTPGGRLEIPLGAVDPDGDVLQYAVRNAEGGSLPGGRLDAVSGTLTFAPNSAALGSYQVEVTASDGVLTTARQFTLQVVADTLTTTRVSGRVLDVDGTPLGGLQLEVGAVHGLTQADGSFLLDLGAGPLVTDTLKVRGETYAGSGPSGEAVHYPFVAEKLPLLLERAVEPGVNNVIARSIFLPRLDLAHGQAIDPLRDVTVTTAALPGVQVYVAAGTLMNQQGTPFTGVLSVTEVPVDLTPAALPEPFHPDLVVTIQPGEMLFARPAPLTLPNRAGYEPGTKLDLWSINPVTGQFDDVGTGRVSADGSVIETISGGIRNSSWHFFASPGPTSSGTGTGDGGGGPTCAGPGPGPGCSPGPGPGSGSRSTPPVGPPTCPKENEPAPGPKAECVEGGASVGSDVEFRYGTLTETHALTTYQSLGVERGVVLRYDSLRADPRPIIRFGLDNVPAPGDKVLTARLSFPHDGVSVQYPGFTGDESGDLLGFDGGEHFWKLPGSSVRAGLQVDLSWAPTGLYPYELVTGFFRDTGGSPRFAGTTLQETDSIISVNSRSSPFGAGWSIAGLQQLVENADGSVLLVDGDGEELLFQKPLAVGGPWVSPAGDFTVLEKLGDGTFRRTNKDRTTSSFDAQNRLASVRDRNGNESRYTYGAGGVLTKITDAVGLETTFASSGGRITSITDPAGRSTQLDYDAAGNLVRVTDPDGTFRTWTYDGRHLMTGEVDQRGEREQEIWSPFGRLTATVRKDGSRLALDPVITRGVYPFRATLNPFDAPVAAAPWQERATFTDGNGDVRQITLDDRGQGVSASDALGSLGTTVRNDQNLVTKQIDALGHETSYTYDGRGNLLTEFDELSAGITQDLFPGRVYSTGGRPTSLAAGDVNGDGLADLLVGALADQFTPGVSLLLGQGGGGFADAVRFTPGDDAASVTFVTLADLEGDGDLDLLVAYQRRSSGAAVSAFVNQGGGALSTPVTMFYAGFGAKSLSTGDVDGDGLLDVLVADETSGTQLVGWDGAQFTGLGGPIQLPFGSIARLADVNRDGRIDLVASREVQLGRGDGTFGSRFLLPTSGSDALAVADWNGDGNLDVVVTGHSGIATLVSKLELALGDGTGRFLAGPRFSSTSLFFGEVAPADVDGDGDLDLLAHATGKQDGVGVGAVVFVNRGDGTFADGQAVNGNAYFGDATFGLEVLDVNRDRIPDIARINQVEGNVVVSLGRGDGTFVDRADVALDGFAVRAVAAADLDHDGDLDLVVSRNDGAFRLQTLLNQGGGAFAASASQVVAQLVTQIQLADLDADGRVDMVTTDYGPGGANAEVSVWRGDGAGGFAAPVAISLPYPSDLRLGDLNQDGQLDLVVAGGGNTNNGDGTRFAVLLGAGGATFAAPTLIPTSATHEMSGVALADLNGDGRLDVVTSDYAASGAGPGVVTVQLGGGDGTFAAATFTDVGRFPTSLDAADLNGDGHVDVVVANHDDVGPSVSLLTGNGQGGLTEAARFPLPAKPLAVKLQDVDGNGSVDVVVSLEDGRTAVFPGDGRGGVFPRRDYSDTSTSLCGVFDASYLCMGSLVAEDVTGDHVPDLIMNGIAGTSGPVSLAVLPGSGGNQPGGPRRWTYESTFNRPTSVTDELGRRTLYDVDPANGNVRSTVVVVGAVGGSDDLVAHFTYTPRGRLATKTDPNGHVTRYEYDVRGRLVTVTEAFGTADAGVTRYEYDAAGNVTATIDPNGNRTTVQYDAMNRPTRVTAADPDGLAGPLAAPVTTMTYDAAGDLLGMTDPRGNVTRFRYDARGRLVQSTDALSGVTQTSYDRDGNLVSSTDELGHVTTYRYDARHRLIAVTDPNGGVSQYEYDLNDNLVAAVDAAGRRTTMKYDARDQLIRQTDALGFSTNVRYDSASQLIAQTDANGHVTRLEYDDAGRLVASIDPLGGRATLEYDAAGNVVAVVDALGRRSRSQYDARDRVVRVVDPLDHATNYAYDDAGNLLRSTDALGRVSTVAYDALDRPVQSTDSLGGVRTVVYDSNDNVVSSVDPLGREVQFQYDALNRRTRAADPLGHSVTWSYDAVGGVTSVTDALGHATQFVYNVLHQLIRTIDPRSASTSYEYDEVGNLTKLTDAVGNATTYAYDALNQPVAVTNALGATRSYQYDSVGNLAVSTDRNGRVRRYEYDALDRRTAELWLDGGGAVVRKMTYAIDPASQLTSATDPDSAYAFEYDDAGRLTRQTNAGTPGAPTVVFAFEYDAVDNLVSRADTLDGQPKGLEEYQYDALNRLIRVTQSGVGVAAKRVDFTYDAAGQTTGVARFADLAGNQSVAVSSYGYDAAGRLTGLVHAHGATTLAQYAWTFDAANRITRMVTPDGTSDFQYDAADQLTAVDHSFQTDEAYAYDANGNRTSAGYQTGPNNRLLSDGTFNYQYDAEGNRTRRTNIATSERTDYEWDYRNRLTHVVVKNTAGAITRDMRYTYDLYDRRVAKSVDSDGTGPTAAVVVRFVYDGHHIVASFDGVGALTHRYLHGSAIDQILADETATEQVLWSLADHEGTVRDLLDSAGVTEDHMTYDSFGRIVSETNRAVDHLFAYSGREFDVESDLYFYRARFYDPIVGRFLSEDPIGFRSHDTNLFRYAMNSPPNATDPLGTEAGLHYTFENGQPTTQPPDMEHGNHDLQVFSSGVALGALTTYGVIAAAPPALLLWTVGAAGAYFGVREMAQAWGGWELGWDFSFQRQLSHAEQQQRRRDFLLGSAGGLIGGGGGLAMGLRTLNRNSAGLLAEILSAIRSSTFLSRATARGATAEQIATLTSRMENMAARGAITECLAGGEATTSSFSVGRLNVLSSRRSRIFHELGHMLDDVMRPGLLETVQRLGPAYGYDAFYEAEAMGYYMQQGVSFLPQTAFNAFMQAYPRAGLGLVFVGLPLGGFLWASLTSH